MGALFLVSFLLSLAGLLSTYAQVLVPLDPSFRLSSRDVSRTSGFSYLSSPYWVGMPRRATISISLVQPFALLGLIYWSVWFSFLTHPPFPSWQAVMGTQVFFLSSSVWPYATHALLRSRERSRGASEQRSAVSSRVWACVPLWAAASGVTFLLVRTAQTGDGSPLSTLSIASLSVATLVALGLDALVWSAYCLLSM